MATIINTPPNVTTDGSDSSGWAVSVIILIAVVGIGIYFFYYYRGAPATPNGAIDPKGAIDVNVTLPVPAATTPAPVTTTPAPVTTTPAP